MSDVLLEVRCRGCRRLIGVAPADFRVYCDEWCADDFPAVASEGRDALIEAIYQHRGPSKSALGRLFGISRQRVDQILLQRDIKVE